MYEIFFDKLTKSPNFTGLLSEKLSKYRNCWHLPPKLTKCPNFTQFLAEKMPGPGPPVSYTYVTATATTTELLHQNTWYLYRQPHRVDCQSLCGYEKKRIHEVENGTCINANVTVTVTLVTFGHKQTQKKHQPLYIRSWYAEHIYTEW